MKIIYFKRAGKDVKYLHPEFITEHVDGIYLTEDQKLNYESMIEEHFELELAKNDERREAHSKYLKEQEVLEDKAKEDARLGTVAQQKELEREFEIFKRWKRNNANKER